MPLSFRKRLQKGDILIGSLPARTAAEYLKAVR
jgi:hypothetical protein